MYSGHSPPPVSAGAVQRVRTLLRPVLIVICVLMAVFAAAGFFLPRSLHLEEEIEIKAPVGAAYQTAADLKEWPQWVPVFKRDAFSESSVEGPASGPGLLLKWKSSQGDECRIKLQSEMPPSALHMALDAGSRASVQGQWSFSENSGVTHVKLAVQADFGGIWGSTGGRWWALFFRGSIRNDMREALEALKARVEKGKS